jgi:hypothetical protein
MYLSMTDQDYEQVRREARLHTAKELGLGDGSTLSDAELDSAINIRDHVAHDLLQRFLDTYQLWWETSRELAESHPASPSQRERLVKMIDARDEIRKTLLNYLGYVRAREFVNT